MTIKGVHHVSFTVTNIERTIEFYSKFLGLELIKRTIVEHDKFGIALGLKQSRARVKVALMKAGDTEIEFIEYVEPKAQPCKQNPSIAGSGHIAFRVDDIYATKKKLEDVGIQFNSEVNIVEEGDFKGWKWCYFRDYEGITMEILQE